MTTDNGVTDKRGFNSVEPPDQNDPPKFSQMRETLKDIFVKSLQDFFQQENIDTGRIFEIPNITAFESSEDDPDRSANVIRRHYGKNEDLPQIVVLASSGESARLAFNNTFIGVVYPNPQVTTAPGPFVFREISKLSLRTQPKKYHNWVNTEITIPSGTITSQELADLINEQSRLVTAEVSDGRVNMIANGELQKIYPRVIEVIPSEENCALSQLGLLRRGTGELKGTRPNATLESIGSFDEFNDHNKKLIITDSKNPNNNFETLIENVNSNEINFENCAFVPNETVSWTISEREDHLSRRIPPRHRYCHRRKMSVVIQVIAESEQTREELGDILLTYYDFIMQENFYTYSGREVDGELDHNERYEIVLSPKNSNSAEQEIERSVDKKDKLFILQITLPVEMSFYVDRPLVIQEGPAEGENLTLEWNRVKVNSSLSFNPQVN